MNQFETQWPGGYRENFDVYEKQIGLSESQVVDRCLRPFYGRDKQCLEIGCGGGFWTEKLMQNFAFVTATDVIDPGWFFRNVKSNGRVDYQHVQPGTCTLPRVIDNTIDFVWSFGVMCHLPFSGNEEYARSIMRVLKPGGVMVVEYSDAKRRPEAGGSPDQTNTQGPIWCDNHREKMQAVLGSIGFVDIEDMFPTGAKTTILKANKPK